MRVLVLALVALASFRAWRLLGRDDITDVLRRPWWGRGRTVAEVDALRRRKVYDAFIQGVTCPWCFGTHVAVAVVVLVNLFVYDFVSGAILNRAGFVALAAAAVTAVVGFLGEIDGRLS